jgi:molybdopterin synthase sulfur carrier subunit
MAVKIESFGQLSEITGKSFEVDVNDTDQLVAVLHDRYQALGNIKYLVAVNRKVVTGNIQLSPADTIALLPPYSGG